MRRRLDLQLDLTSRCNIRCVMCYFSAVDRLHFKPFEIDTGPRGNMSMSMFRHIASELFPVARSVGLGCAAEPLIHPDFAEILERTRAHGVPKVWIQTNLLALDPATATSIVRNRVTTVAVSIDGTTRESYEIIRSGASWTRLHERLELLRDAKASARSALPRLRITFAWMRSNRDELTKLPGFARDLGASELDVRFVAPTVGVDNSRELLDHDDQDAISADLWSTARAATRLGLRLAAYPALRREASADTTIIGKIVRRLWLLRSGLDGPRRWRQSFIENREGCSFPGRTLLIRPNGAVEPCPFWEEDPIAFVPQASRAEILEAGGIARIREGLRRGCPVGSCSTCSVKQDALFRPSGEPGLSGS